MALTLLESAKIALGRDEVLKAAVMEMYAESSDILRILPFENISGNALAFNREKTLPGTAFRGVNEAYTESTGEVEKITESLVIAGGDVDVDVMLVKTAGMEQRQVQSKLKVKSLALNMTKTIVKGDVTSDAKSFDGLQARCTGTQLISNGSTAATSAALSLAKLDELIDSVEDPTHLIMNKTLRRRLTQAARTTTVSGYITYDVDEFGRRITKYNDLPILIVDKDETNAEIMPFTETTGAGTTAGCSIYCVSFMDDGVVGIQNGEMDVRDLGEIDTKPVYRTRIEWYLSLAVQRPYSVARLWNVLNGAVTA